MEAVVITAVGIDVSKSKSTVAVRRPGGEIVLRPFEVHHTNSDLKKLACTYEKQTFWYLPELREACRGA